MFEKEIKKEQDLLNQLKKFNVIITCKDNGDAIFTQNGIVISKCGDYEII